MILLRSESLKSLVAQIFLGAGSKKIEANAIAENLVTANLMGHDSHGVHLVLRYVETALGGRLTVNGHVQVILDNDTFLLLDGGMAYGQVVGAQAMEHGISKARQFGTSIVGLRNVHHLGRIGAWGELCAEAGLISIHYVNAAGHPPLVAPFGGADARFSTNPYCTAFPATNGSPSIVLDMATSRVAMGKVVVAYNKGESAPEDSLIDANGDPSNDPAVMFSDPPGALRSIGLHKGYGLAVVCEILAGALTGGGTAKPDLFGLDTIRNNMLSILIDPSRLGERDDFSSEVEAFKEWMKGSPSAPGADGVMMPGEPERKTFVSRVSNGIPVDEETWQQVVKAGLAVGLEKTHIERVIQ